MPITSLGGGGGGGSGPMLTQVVVLDATQLDALQSVPLEVIPGRAGFVPLILGAMWYFFTETSGSSGLVVVFLGDDDMPVRWGSTYDQAVGSPQYNPFVPTTGLDKSTTVDGARILLSSDPTDPNEPDSKARLTIYYCYTSTDVG